MRKRVRPESTSTTLTTLRNWRRNVIGSSVAIVAIPPASYAFRLPAVARILTRSTPKSERTTPSQAPSWREDARNGQCVLLITGKVDADAVGITIGMMLGGHGTAYLADPEFRTEN